jgi:hypothetical protein
MTPRVKQARLRLGTMSLSAEQAKTLDRQIEDAIVLYLHRFNVDKPIRGQMESLARDAYLQGLIDGAQLPHPPREEER